MTSDRTKQILTALAASALVAVGCGSDEATAGADGGGASAAEESAAAEPSSKTEAQPAAVRGPRVKLRQTQFGRVLFSGGDRAIYLFTRDDRDRTRCYGACAEAWPPFFAKGRPQAGSGVQQSLLGTIRRRDGRRQVTYRGHPLYFYVDDPPRQVLCQDVEEFGGLWLVVKANGRAVR
jgi:predicted lipoprotein with Yx(FWY)xxD motif